MSQQEKSHRSLQINNPLYIPHSQGAAGALNINQPYRMPQVLGTTYVPGMDADGACML